jgi:hypothetical protein
MLASQVDVRARAVDDALGLKSNYGVALVKAMHAKAFKASGPQTSVAVYVQQSWG